MTPELKEKLLLRKFSSIEYMKELSDYHQKSVDGLLESIQWFYDNPPSVDWQSWHISSRPDGWEKKAVPNFHWNQKSIDEGIDHVKKGDFSYIEGAAGNLMSIDKDLDNLGKKWWKHIPREVAYKFGKNLGKARDIASNIWRTAGDYWDPGEILEEEITGPIDEQELLKYLKPGETV